MQKRERKKEIFFWKPPVLDGKMCFFFQKQNFNNQRIVDVVVNLFSTFDVKMIKWRGVMKTCIIESYQLRSARWILPSAAASNPSILGPSLSSSSREPHLFLRIIHPRSIYEKGRKDKKMGECEKVSFPTAANKLPLNLTTAMLSPTQFLCIFTLQFTHFPSLLLFSSCCCCFFYCAENEISTRESH